MPKFFFFFCSQRWRSAIQSAKTRLGADCGSNHELLNAKFRLKFKKVGKTTRSFSYDLNQIPYDYTMEGTNRFKGFNLIDRVPEELWTEVLNIVQEAVTKTSPKKNTREDSTHGHHQMVNTEIRLIMFLQPKMEKLYRVSRNKTGS